MFIFEIFNRKKLFKKNDEEILDLTKSSLNYKNTNIRIQSFVKVTAEMTMRPDLIAHQAWGSDTYTDILLKFNAISNPFSIEEGDIISIPYLDDMLKNLTEEDEREDIRDMLLDPSKLSEKDKKRIEYLQRKAQERGKSASQQPLPPNFENPDTNEIVIKDGVVTFANNGPINTECGDTISKAEFKAKMIEKRIQNQGK